MVAEHSKEIDLLKVCLECHRQFTGIISACPHDGTLLVTVAQDPLIGTTLVGKYEILSVVGHGGMGVVYESRDVLMDRLVAIKMLKAQLISDSMSVKRFHHEGKAASRINHPHVITVHEFGISPSGQPFIVMDFLDGTSLAHQIKANGNVGVERTVKILTQACDALNHAHRQGVVHRDLKPSNIVLIDYDGEKDFVKVVDFGVAKLITGAGQDLQRLTQDGEVCGSPVYMSPEQCKGHELDARSDIYSMGIVMYETLTGTLPLIGQTMVETMSKHISDTPAPFSEVRPDLYIPERLEMVVFKALSKEPSERQQSMAQLKLDLEIAIPRPGRSQVLRSPDAQVVKPTVSMRKGLDKLVRSTATRAIAGLALLIICGITFARWIHDISSTVRTVIVPIKSTTNPLPPINTTPVLQRVTTPSTLPQGQPAIPEGQPAKVLITPPTSVAPPKPTVTTVTPKPEEHKATQPIEARRVPDEHRVLRRSAYSTLAAENSLRQHPSESLGRKQKNLTLHHKPTLPMIKSAVDPFKELDQMHSYKRDW